MRVNTVYQVPQKTFSQSKSGKSDFSGYLAKSMAAKKSTSEDLPHTSVKDEIREKGFLNYINEQREEKIREKILAARGLTEESLAEMSFEQRSKIEQMISEEIQKRLAAESILKREGGGDPLLSFF